MNDEAILVQSFEGVGVDDQVRLPGYEGAIFTYGGFLDDVVPGDVFRHIYQVRGVSRLMLFYITNDGRLSFDVLDASFNFDVDASSKVRKMVNGMKLVPNTALVMCDVLRSMVT